MSLSTEQAQIEFLTATRSAMELALINVSEEKTAKYTNLSGQLAALTSAMAAETDAVRKALSQDASSQEYQQMRDAIEEIEQQYEVLIQNIRDQITRAESDLDTKQESIETQLEVIRSMLDSWKEARDDTVEDTFSYFQT